MSLEIIDVGLSVGAPADKGRPGIIKVNNNFAFLQNLFNFDETTKGLNLNNGVIPLGTTDAKTLHNLFASFNPTVSNSQENWRHLILDGQIGNDDSGNQLGDNTNGGLEMFSAAINSQFKSNVGQARSISAYGNFGNATDAINVRSYAAYGGNLQIRNNVTAGYVSVLEYGFNLEVGSSVEDIRGFNLNGNVAEITQGLNGYSLGLNITQGNYANVFSCNNQYGNMSGGINVYGDFSQLTGVGSNSYFSFNANPNLAEVQSYIGLSINPTVGMCDYANGIDINMDNVTVFAGTKGSVTIQDLFFETVNNTGDPFTIEFVDDATAGSESVNNAGPAITVHIESGVSTATQIKAAWDAVPLIVSNVTSTISGVGSNAQNAISPQSLTGGAYPGAKYAAQFKGDVRVDGNFEFTGALNLGLLNAFGTKVLHDNGGQPDSAHSIISALTAPDNATIANADMIGVNTAGLITIGENATITTSFLGVAALGLPAVVQVGNGSTIDRVAGAVFALSLQGSGTGVIDTLDLCKAVAIPNGVTVVNKLHAYNFDLPFGDVGTQIWGLYLQPSVPNWIAGSLKIGGVSGTSDKPTVTNKFELEGGDFSLAADVKTGFYGKAPVVQPASSGAATASGSYTSTEQTMLQEVYDAVRNLGLMS